jgi:hypothetical protein
MPLDDAFQLAANHLIFEVFPRIQQYFQLPTDLILTLEYYERSAQLVQRVSSLHHIYSEPDKETPERSVL